MNGKTVFFVFLMFTVNANVFANCNIEKPNDILDLIKKNHPQISLSSARAEALEKSIQVAGQRPNLELDAESSVGDSLEGKIYTSTVSLKHTFELGSKRHSRVQVAKKKYKAGMAIAKHENQHIIVKNVLSIHRLRQVYELIPLYEESLRSFTKILSKIKKRRSLSPEQQVERETLTLVANDYKLKISQLNYEKKNLSQHLSYYMGTNCIIPRNALPKNINLKELYGTTESTNGYAKLEAASLMVDLAKASLELEKSNAYPDLQIGPTYEYEKINVGKTNSIGVSLTMDLPIFNTNRGGKAKAAKEILSASLNLRNIKNESQLDINTWLSKYNQYKNSLKTISNKSDLERKHHKIESLFRRGIISTSLVIESHRQLIEFMSTRFEFELGATEALWNIYKMNGKIDKMEM